MNGMNNKNSATGFDKESASLSFAVFKKGILKSEKTGISNKQKTKRGNYSRNFNMC